MHSELSSFDRSYFRCCSYDIDSDEKETSRTLMSFAHSQSNLKSSSHNCRNLSSLLIRGIKALAVPSPSTNFWPRWDICARLSVATISCVSGCAISEGERFLDELKFAAILVISRCSAMG